MHNIYISLLMLALLLLTGIYQHCHGLPSGRRSFIMLALWETEARQMESTLHQARTAAAQVADATVQRHFVVLVTLVAKL